MYIRDYTPDDYEPIAAIRTAIYPDMPLTAEDLHESDEKRDPKCNHHIWVAERGGRIAGFAVYDQFIWEYHPQKFVVLVRVLPEYQGQGIGSQLYEVVVDALQAHDPVEFSCNAREDHPHAIDWIKRRGFTEYLRLQWSELEVAAFDPAPFAGIEPKLNAEGIVIASYADMADDPDLDRKLYDLDVNVIPDVPGTENLTMPPFERWRKDVIESPNIKLDAYFMALHEDQVVGISNMWGRRGTDTTLFTGFTGVRRAYRRKGIAAALKTRAILWGRANGYLHVKTDNEETNPMLQLNYRLGFKPTPAWVSFKKQL